MTRSIAPPFPHASTSSTRDRNEGPVSGPLRTNNVYTFEPDAGGTLVTLTDEIELSGIAGIFEPLVARMVRRQYVVILGRLKAILEARPASAA